MPVIDIASFHFNDEPIEDKLSEYYSDELMSMCVACNLVLILMIVY